MVGDDNELGAKLSWIGIEPLQFAERKRSIANVGGGSVVDLEVSPVSAVAMMVDGNSQMGNRRDSFSIQPCRHRRSLRARGSSKSRIDCSD
jgi:hypothetical protein